MRTRSESHGSSALMDEDLASRIARLQERQVVLDERYKTLVAQLGAEVYVRTRRDPAFRAPHESIYAEIEEVAVKCKRGRDRLSELEDRARSSSLLFDRKAYSPERETVHAHSTGRHAAPSRLAKEKKSPEASKELLSASSVCWQCGANVEQGDAFCAMCGAVLTEPEKLPRHGNVPVREARSSHEEETDSVALRSTDSAPTPASRIDVKGSKVSSSKKIGAVFDIIAILLTFIPWVGLNLYVWSGNYSLPGLIQLVFKANNAASSYLGSSYASSNVSTNIFVAVVFVTLIWLAITISLGVDAYARLSASRKTSSSGPLISFVCMAGAVIVACFVVDMSLSSQLSQASLSVSGVVTASSGAWISFVVGIAFWAYLEAKSE